MYILLDGRREYILDESVSKAKILRGLQSEYPSTLPKGIHKKHTSELLPLAMRIEHVGDYQLHVIKERMNKESKLYWEVVQEMVLEKMGAS
ncbi:hypothetical protein EQG49_00350 [Periweissella cryptocerci]|uniref:Uncharacterized protein n=1 Tax=Periweissella cryptocerci TaxID=2506420 RepID=A0A4V1AIC3_9LACO|nr:hypothetical protein [Periweissella cryptocerci]QBO35005.1 hypothetical protein EQG49_00350 [Periweissella cryptocerci]